MSLDTRPHGSRTGLVTGLTATGTNQATAFQLSNSANFQFTTVASGTGAKMTIPEIPSRVVVDNQGANALLLYPALGGTLGGGSVNASVSIPAGTSVAYYATSSTNWDVEVTGGSGGGGSGTVTQVTGSPANGFTVAVATGTTTPAITITTSVTGIMKGNGTAASPATAGTDYVVPGTSSKGVILAEYSTPPVAASWSGAVSLDLTSGNLFVGTLAANATLTFSGQSNGQPVRIYVIQGAGNYSITFPTMKWLGSTYPTSQPTMPTTSGEVLATSVCEIATGTIVGSWGGNTNT